MAKVQCTEHTNEEENILGVEEGAGILKVRLKRDAKNVLEYDLSLSVSLYPSLLALLTLFLSVSLSPSSLSVFSILLS